MLRRLLPLALLLAAPAVVGAEEAPAPAPAPVPPAAPAEIPATLVIPTETVPNEAVPNLTPGAPSPRTGFFVAQPSLQVEFEATGEKDGRVVLEGTLELGARQVAITLLRGAGDDLALLADVDGDGAVDPAKERLEAKGRPWRGGGQVLGTEWPVEGLRLLGHPVLAHVRERLADLTVQAIVPAARRGDRPEESHALVLQDDPPGGVKTLPAGPGKTSFAAAKIAGKEVLLAVRRGEGDALDLVWADAETGDLAAGAKVPMTGTPMLRNKKRVGTRWQAAPLALGGKQVVFTAVEHLPNVQGLVNAPATRRATATVGGAEWMAFLLDGDLDGSFAGPHDAWWLGPRVEPLRPNVNNMTEGDEPRFLDCGAWRLRGLDAQGAATFVRAEDGASFEDYLRRRTERVNAKRWFPRFAEDQAFPAQQKLDATRPVAKDPVRFRFARDLTEALAIAAKEGKPLLVDFEADWCVWCKRLDYHTYPDLEVNEWLAKFTPVKVNNDLDSSRSFDRLKDPAGNPWRGIPAVGIFGADGLPIPFELAGAPDRPGRVVDHVPGWLKPEAFVAALRAAYAQYESVKAGNPRLPMGAPAGAGAGPTEKPGTPAPGATPPGHPPVEKPGDPVPQPK